MRGESELKYDPHEGSFSAWYFEHRLPIAPERYSDILKTSASQLSPTSGHAGKEGGQFVG